MAYCPRCGKNIPIKAIFTATDLSAVVCACCNAGLWPTRWSSFSLLMVSYGLGGAALHLLPRAGVGLSVRLPGLMGTMLVVYLLLAGVILRMRLKESRFTSLEAGDA